MRILHLYKDYFPVLGGIENHIRVLAEAQAAAGHAVTVLVCDPSRTTRVEEMNGVRVVKAGRLTTAASMPLSLRQPWHLLSSLPDVIHVQSPYPLGELSASLLKPRRPLVISYQSDIVRQRGWLRLYGPLLSLVLRHAARILVSSPRYLDSSPWLQPVREKCVVVPLGVDIHRFAPPSQAYQGVPTLLFVGRLRYYKGLDTLIRAMTGLPEEVQLRIVGEGEMESSLRALSAELGLLDRVHFAGEIPDADLPAEYHRASIFVLPANARAEAFGMVLLEAMASGLPCVTTEVGTGTSWVVQDGITGRVVPPQDPAALAAALRALLADPEQLHGMGQAARARAVTEFAQERLVDRVMAVYRSLL
jgi:glycosyltransferase involved in cell wall biosynthesis